MKDAESFEIILKQFEASMERLRKWLMEKVVIHQPFIGRKSYKGMNN